LQTVLREEKDTKIRSSAIRALGQIRAPSATETLYRLLESENIQDRGMAVGALGEIKDKAAIPRLMKLLEDDRNSSLEYVLPAAFEEINDRQIVPELLSLLKSEKGWVRKIAVRALGKVGDASHTQEVMNTVLDPQDEDLQAVVIKTLGKLQNPLALPYLVKALHISSLQGKAITALERLGKSARTAVPEIIKIAQSKEGSNRIDAILCLGKIGDAETATFLLELTPEEKVAHFAAQATEALVEAREKIDVHKAGTYLLSEQVLDYVRSHLAYILGLTENPEAVPYLLQALEDPSPNVRAHIIHALEDLEDPRAVPKLIECLEDDEIPVWPENMPGEPISKTAESALLMIAHPDGLRAIEDRRKRNEQDG
jgi:HEAT repeat protein